MIMNKDTQHQLRTESSKDHLVVIDKLLTHNMNNNKLREWMATVWFALVHNQHTPRTATA